MPEYTTHAVGEEDLPTTLWVEDGPSTRMYGEEGEFIPGPTTLRWGEEQDSPNAASGVEDPFGGF
ncbi:MAG TPA: hypothetical protein VFX98_09405 [Longimicrobiaceae bacterium]|nr:hypothetical protein [Longimicrobiaceae bacterium]